MPTCRDCGEEIKFVQNWREKWYPCEVEAQPDKKPIYIEVTKNEFVAEWRHECEGRPTIKRRVF